MARKISVYVDEALHRSLKAAASLQGVSLSDFMVSAAKRAMYAPDRRGAAAKMDVVRETAGPGPSYTSGEIRSMREEGRRIWPRE